MVVGEAPAVSRAAAVAAVVAAGQEVVVSVAVAVVVASVVAGAVLDSVVAAVVEGVVSRGVVAAAGFKLFLLALAGRVCLWGMSNLGSSGATMTGRGGCTYGRSWKGFWDLFIVVFHGRIRTRSACVHMTVQQVGIEDVVWSLMLSVLP